MGEIIHFTGSFSGFQGSRKRAVSWCRILVRYASKDILQARLQHTI